jgi:hypothetical protein
MAGSDPIIEVSCEPSEIGGYDTEVINTTWPDDPGHASRRVRILLEPMELITRQMRKIVASISGPIPDNQILMVQAAQDLAKEGQSRGHREAIAQLLAHIDRLYNIQAPVACQFEGYYDSGVYASTEVVPEGSRVFEIIERAIADSIIRAGKHEPGSSDRKEWSLPARKRADDAYRRMPKVLQLEPELADKQVANESERLTVDWDGLAAAANLDVEEIAFLQYGSGREGARAELLSRKTGEVWDAKRVDRVRQRVAYRLPQIRNVIPDHLVWVNGKSVVKLKTYKNPSVDYVHEALVALFRD